MGDNATFNITQILTSFDNFVTLLENPNWYRSASSEEIKNSFKLGLFLEKSLANFRMKNFTHEFFCVLNQWWQKQKHRSQVYNEQFFQFSCNELLIRFFKCENVSETSLEVAIRVYTSMFPKHRFKSVIKSLMLSSSTQEAVHDFTKAHSTCSKEMEYSLVLESWSKVLKSGRESDVRREVENKLSSHKLETTLQLLVGILSLNDVTDSERSVQVIILENILYKMLDKSLLNKNFWLIMFRKVELPYICKTCDNFDKFFLSIIDFVIYISSVMKNGSIVSESDETVSLCPEITYSELSAFLRGIYNAKPCSRKFIIHKLEEAQQQTESDIWIKLKHDLRS